MKYKLLLIGKNKIIIDDFFSFMSNDFECVTTSTRNEDVSNHIKYFQPNACVCCITNDMKHTIPDLINALSVADALDVKIILIGDSDACRELTRQNSKLVSLTLLKPIAANTIRQQIIKFFEDLQAEKERQIQEEMKWQKIQEEEELARMIEAMDDRKHILVIDDDPRMLRLIKAELKDEYNVATAVSGKVGLNFLQRKKTDLILLDYEMPEQNGAEVLECIRRSKELRHIPVVFLTGTKERGKIQKVLSLKPQGYLLKPIQHDQLLEAIRQVIG